MGPSVPNGPDTNKIRFPSQPACERLVLYLVAIITSTTTIRDRLTVGSSFSDWLERAERQ